MNKKKLYCFLTKIEAYNIYIIDYRIAVTESNIQTTLNQNNRTSKY